MFEEFTEDYFMDQARALGEEYGVDTRQGSLLMDAATGHCIRIAKFMNDLSTAFEMLAVDTCTGDVLTEKAAQDGYVVYTFDFCGGSLNGNSDVDFMDMTVMTEKEDLSAVMDFVKTKDYVDQDHLFLLGQSQGGLVSALTAADRKDDVAAMILIYPAFCIADNAREMYDSAYDIPEDRAEMPVGTVGSEYVKTVYDLDVYGTISAYDGDVMIIHGINDSLVPYSYSEKAIEEAYTGEGSVLIPIYGKKSTHGFEMNFEEGRDYAETVGLEFLDVHLKEEE